MAHSWGAQTEGKKTPDFLFPSAEHYRNLRWNGSHLRMLATKTTCKDRWRQILNEADRIKRKHLLTLQEGVSVDQHREMEAANVQLVVPRRLFSAYPEQIRTKLMAFEEFINDARALPV